MCQFKVMPIQQSDYDVIVFAESFESPLESLDEVAEELRRNEFSGRKKVLFDSLLSIGNNEERFAEAYFEDDFLFDTFKYVKILKTDILRKDCAAFFQNNSSILENSVLTKVQRELIRKGVIL